jgi:FkbM family methyltransferase
MSPSQILEELFYLLPNITDYHAPQTPLHQFLKKLAHGATSELFSDTERKAVNLQPFGDLIFPYRKMGEIDSINLFDLDELIIFSFYLLNRNNYRNVLDAGANLGLHSLLLDKCGFQVRCFEPDPVHYKLLEENLDSNKSGNVQANNRAVSTHKGEAEFIRVLGNTTGSHLAGCKKDPYGNLEKFKVEVVDIRPHLEWANLVKMDIEGHEKEILLSTSRELWETTDALVEVQDQGNAEDIFKFFTDMQVNLFPQKINWKCAKTIADIPVNSREGTLFISCKEKMLWHEGR